MPPHTTHISICGAGLVGALLATLLARQGFSVDVYEKRPDPRRGGVENGRSINLALAERGLAALRQAGVGDDVLQRAVMMRGRMVHEHDRAPNLQRYGVDDSEVLWSVSRGALNDLLLDAAEAAGARLHFHLALIAADPLHGRLTVEDTHGQQRDLRSDAIIGADGAGSALRAAMRRVTDLGERVEPLGHGYKELEIPPTASRGFAIEPHALHIWPRGAYMCIALPNLDGSFTVTLFLPHEGAQPSFESLADEGAPRALFEHDFADALALMPGFDRDFAEHPVGSLATLYLKRWHVGRALLIGDAAHAIVPFHGQGMNAGFEDAAALARALGAQTEVETVFAHFQAERKPNADAIAAMALENYTEMRDAVADPHYLRRRQLAMALAERAPDHFMPRYRMVTFTHLPYAYAYERGKAQGELLESLLASTPDVDLDVAERTLRATLPPLPELCRG
ncbi:NAD(P)/FAD-dependent oxidoreductase [Oleiagrimonas sp. C23AA]|uniref:FAD-dependent oxidoreductase n=1 Tax=Oleiagrimonas sp. C23AA TaxID=2719047 RepID=UPI00141E991F|nr:NAD(P)/FAD-dependent oxidoreductase [Oleiagrimonas sp. C23AA]NII09452.1 FAD-dependent monooxygenase [Oleiagrimonas sp. C23AA]